MENCQVHELMEIKRYYEDTISKLDSQHKEWISFAAEQMLTNASNKDMIEEARLGEKSENHVLTAAKNLVNEAYNIAKNKVKTMPSKQSVERVCSTSPWKLDGLSAHPVRTETLKISDVKGSVTQLHQVRWKYGDESADNCIFLWAVAEYETTTVDGSIDGVANVKISLEVPEKIERYFTSAEMRPLVEYCSAEANLPLFFATSAALFSKWEKRQHIIRKLNLQRECQITTETPNDFTIDFVNSEGHEIVKLYWPIKYDIYDGSMKESITANFSHVGKQLAKEYNFPEELILTGRYDPWCSEEFVANVARMIHFEKSD